MGNSMILIILLMLVMVGISSAIPFQQVLNPQTGVGDIVRSTNQSGESWIIENLTVESLTADISVGLSSTNIYGSDLSGNSGEINRNYSSNADLVSVDNSFLHPTIDYDKSSGYVIFLKPVWDDMLITLWKNQLTNLSYVNYLGSDLSGSSGGIDRALIITDSDIIIIDNQFLHPIIDYTTYSQNITF